MDLSRYAELFLTESQEHLQSINDALLELERSGFQASAIDSLFRSVHTIKGMSAAMGFDRVAELSHEMESLLAELRAGTRELDSVTVDALFEATDVLETAVGESSAGKAEFVDVSAGLKTIREARSARQGAAQDQVLAGDARRDDNFPALDIPNGAIRVQVRIRRDAALPGVRAFMVLQRLSTLGELQGLAPPQEEIQADGFDGRFVCALRTAKPPDSVRESIAGAGEVDWVGISAIEAGSDATPAAVDGQSAGGRAAEPQAEAKPRKASKHVRVEQRRLDSLMNMVGELVITRGRLAEKLGTTEDSELEEILTEASRQISGLRDDIMASRMVPVWQVFDRFPRLVRDAARALDKKVEFVMEGRELELDRSLLDEIGDPLVHLLRNAVDHGLETVEQRKAAGKSESGRIVLSAMRDREAVLLSVSDDGKGIDRQRVLRRARELELVGADATEISDELLFSIISRSGFSTAERVTDLSGRGVGVDAVASRVRALGGTLELHTEPGQGTTVTIRLPLTLAIIRAMLARAGTETYALPLTHVAETVEVDASTFRTVRGREVAIVREEVLPVLRLRSIVELPVAPDLHRQMLVLEAGDRRAGLIVDDLLGQQEIVVKQFDAVRSAAQLFSGATILGNGEPALIVDVGSIL